MSTKEREFFESLVKDTACEFASSIKTIDDQGERLATMLSKQAWPALPRQYRIRYVPVIKAENVEGALVFLMMVYDRATHTTIPFKTLFDILQNAPPTLGLVN